MYIYIYIIILSELSTMAEVSIIGLLLTENIISSYKLVKPMSNINKVINKAFYFNICLCLFIIF